MNNMEIIPVLVRMICSFLAGFTAIAVWSRTRSAAWMFIVLGALAGFVDSLFATFVLIGLTTYSLPFWPGIPLLKSVLAGLPFIFLSTGFLVFLLQNRRY